jgi:solute carrier family 35 protein F1/2
VTFILVWMLRSWIWWIILNVVVKAYQYTSITSVMLLDCFTIPVALGLTYLCLRTKYNWRHLIGVALCLAGLGILVYDDAVKNGSNEGSKIFSVFIQFPPYWHHTRIAGSNPLLGDALCLGAATLYAVSNVGQEATVKKFSRSEFLAMVGIFGALVGGTQLYDPHC